ncbi:MAG: TRAP transporter large permease subunit [Rhizobiaceae bacterium]|nr:TRAP transporter large permease subunit [Rhizobiaceae bacterium]
MSVPLDLLLLVTLVATLMVGYPVGLTLGGVSVIFAALGVVLGEFDPVLLFALPSRLFGVMTNSVLVSIPLFVFMGLVLERSKLAEEMLDASANLFSGLRGGLLVSVVVVGAMMAASTGIVGASVVTLGLLALPGMLRNGVPPHLAAGTVAASGTLGQIIPPSIVLIVLGDQMSNAWQKMQLDAGEFAPETVSIADLFAGALLPGLLIVGLFVTYLMVLAPRPLRAPENPGVRPQSIELLRAFLAPTVLIMIVLGSILLGVATPSEAAGIGAVGALLLARKRLDKSALNNLLADSVHLISMIFLIVIGASIFSLVFRGLGGEETITALLSDLPGGTYGALIIVMLVIFGLGFFLEFLEISLVVVPLVAPILLAMPLADGSAMSPIWLGVLIAINLQTSFLTPPFGLSLFYLRSVADQSMPTTALYRGVIPFVALQLLALACVMIWPDIATILPQWLYGE